MFKRKISDNKFMQEIGELKRKNELLNAIKDLAISNNDIANELAILNSTIQDGLLTK